MDGELRVTQEVLLHCHRCNARHRTEVQAVISPCGELASIRRGTLNNDWVLRWALAHAEPCVHPA